MTLREIMMAASGQDEHGMPNCSMVLFNEFWSQDGERETVNEIVLDSPTVRFFQGDGFVQVDLDFGSKHNVDLSFTYDAITNFRQIQNSIDENAEKMPVTTLMILPAEYEGEFYLACVNPLWVGLTAEKPTDDLAIIRMTFLEDSVLLYENIIEDGDNKDTEE